MNQNHMPTPSNTLSSRRHFLKFTASAGISASTLGLTLGFHLPAQAQHMQGDDSDSNSQAINAWLSISPTNHVTCQVAQAEMGQGTSTGLPMMLAEELECEWSDVRIAFASVNKNTGAKYVEVNFATGGSKGIRNGQLIMRKAGATAREMLKAAAAQLWHVQIPELVAKDGRISHLASNRSTTYGALASAAAKLPVPHDVKLKPPSEWKIIGKSMPRFDIPAKTNGSAHFGIDARLPQMLYAAIAHCPVFGGAPQSVDTAALMLRRGVKKVVMGPTFVAVIADNWWRAQQALLSQKITWDFKGLDQLDDAAILKVLREDLSKTKPLRQIGHFETVWAQAPVQIGTKLLEAEYFTPYLGHFTLEPQNCTALVELAPNGPPQQAKITLWVPTQNAKASQAMAAKTLGIPEENVVVNRPYLGGGFGRRGNYQDFVNQAVLVAKEMPGVPVKLLWRREEDMQHDFYRPVALYRQRAVIDSQGQLQAWQAVFASPSIAAILQPNSLENGQDFQAGDGFYDSPYEVPNYDTRHAMTQLNVPIGYWRSVYYSQNPFARESFLDEIFLAMGKDPLQGRLGLLPKDSRDAKVLEAVTQAAGWGKPLPPGRFQGLALQDAFGSYAAAVVELSVSPQKAVTVHKVYLAIDSGHVNNPDSAKAQIQSNVVFALGTVFLNAITIRDGRVQQSNLPDYPLLQLRQTPEIIPILVPIGGDVWGGMGEPPYAALPAALGNAIAAATGVRLRKMPFVNEGFTLA